MNRTQDYNRHMMWKKAIRKKEIDTKVSHVPMYSNLHQYSKNKIHCSCPLCSVKTKRSGSKHYRGLGGYNYSISDQRKVDKLSFDEDEYNLKDFSIQE